VLLVSVQVVVVSREVDYENLDEVFRNEDPSQIVTIFHLS
jgi:hypothetical protein